jgi:hypothetical protein
MLSTRSEAGRGASMTAARRAGTLSVIVPVLNEEANIPELVRRLKAALAGGLPFDVIFVDDGSTDRTSSLLRALHVEDSRIKSIHLTRTFGHQAAISAGLQAATGDAVVVMDGDLQDAPEVVPQFVTRWLDGDDVVYAIRRSREASWVKRVAYRAFYRVLARISAIDLPLDSGDFSLIDRQSSTCSTRCLSARASCEACAWRSSAAPLFTAGRFSSSRCCSWAGSSWSASESSASTWGASPTRSARVRRSSSPRSSATRGSPLPRPTDPRAPDARRDRRAGAEARSSPFTAAGRARIVASAVPSTIDRSCEGLADPSDLAGRGEL